MTDQFPDITKMVPIAPPPELVQQWMRFGNMDLAPFHLAQALATQAARWGSDQELEACCAWLDIPNNRHGSGDGWLISMRLHAARRPKLPTLKAQALLAIDTAVADDRLSADVATVVRRALEQLPDTH
jgi:hypothetical protein